MKTSELFENKTVISFEVFPQSGNPNFFETLNTLAALTPDFISVTNTAGVKNFDKAFELTSMIKKQYGIESAAHLPCVNLSERQAAEFLDKLKDSGVENILALRGDILPNAKPNGRFNHADEFISFINKNYDFNIIAACYPEKHPESKSYIDEINFLKQKAESGASQLITQIFFDNELFYNFRNCAELAEVNLPIEAGIMPVTSKKQLERIVRLCGISVPKKLMKIAQRYENNPIALRDAGIAYAIDQIVDLITQGADGIHIYTMNNPYAAKKICSAVSNLIRA